MNSEQWDKMLEREQLTRSKPKHICSKGLGCDKELRCLCPCHNDDEAGPTMGKGDTPMNPDAFTIRHLNTWSHSYFTNEAERQAMENKILAFITDHPDLINDVDGRSWPEILHLVAR